MKNCKKIKVLFNIISILTLMFMACNVVYGALGDGFNQGIFNQTTSNVSNESISKYKSAVQKVLGTVFLILKIMAFAGVVFTGVKYMFAGAESKGKLKQTLIWVVVGTIFVFGAETIIKYVTRAGANVLM